MFRRKTLTKNRNSCRMWLIVNISTIFRNKCLTFIAFSCIINANVVMRAKKTRHRETETEQRNDTVNQRIDYSIATEVAVDLLGHREMHACRVSMPVVALSRRVPVHLNGNVRGINKESTPPPPYFPLRIFQSMAASAFVGMLPLTPHAFFAWRVIFVASGLARCMFSLPHFWLQPFLLLFPLFVHSCLRDKFPRADFGGAGYYLRAFLIEWVNRADNRIAAGHW